MWLKKRTKKNRFACDTSIVSEGSRASSCPWGGRTIHLGTSPLLSFTASWMLTKDSQVTTSILIQITSFIAYSVLILLIIYIYYFITFFNYNIFQSQNHKVIINLYFEKLRFIYMNM